MMIENVWADDLAFGIACTVFILDRPYEIPFGLCLALFMGHPYRIQQ